MNFIIRVFNTPIIVALSLLAIIAFSSCNKNERTQQLLTESSHIANYSKMSDLSINYSIRDGRLSVDSLSDFSTAIDELTDMIDNDSARIDLINSQENAGFTSLLSKYQDLMEDWDSASTNSEKSTLVSNQYTYFEIDSAGVRPKLPMGLCSVLDLDGMVYIDSSLSKFIDTMQIVSFSGSVDSIDAFIDNGYDTSMTDVDGRAFLRTSHSHGFCPHQDYCEDKDDNEDFRVEQDYHLAQYWNFERVNAIWTGRIKYMVSYSAEFRSYDKTWFFELWWDRNRSDNIDYRVDYLAYVSSVGNKSDYESGTFNHWIKNYYKILYGPIYIDISSGATYPYAILKDNDNNVEHTTASNCQCILKC